MAYKHGLYGSYEPTPNKTAAKAKTSVAYIGTAPVNLVKNWKQKDIVNFPVKISESNAKSVLGYSGDWANFTLCEALQMHFENSIQSVGPIFAINVLNPDLHKRTEATTADIQFINGVARIVSDKIILDTITIADMVAGVDYSVSHNHQTGTALITLLTHAEKATAKASYYEIDPSLVELDDIVGGISEDGEYTGLGALDLVHQVLENKVNVLAAPGWSHNPAIYRALLKAADKINGHFDAFVNADMPIKDVGSIEKAITWKFENDYHAETSKACWPKWEVGSEIYHLSTVTSWLMALTDNSHDGIPMETPSNKIIPNGKLHFGENSKNRGYDKETANKLNAAGITTAVHWGGQSVLWGDHTAAYNYVQMVEGAGNLDKRCIFDNSIRMMMYVNNSFQDDHAMEIDQPMTRAKKDTILNTEQGKLDALISIGALIGSPIIEFRESENSESDLLEGNFTWSSKITPVPPFKSGTLKISYTDEGFSSYYEGGDE